MVIDCDLRRPCIHKVFADNKDNGLVDIFRGGSFDQMVRKTEDPALHYLTTGTNPYQCTELLASLKMTHLLSQLDSQYDLILIDSPPTTVTADAAILSQLVDGTILIARENAVPLSLLKTAVDGLEKVGADLLGVIVNCMDLNRQRYSLRYGYGYNYRYSYSYEYGKEDRERAKEAAN